MESKEVKGRLWNTAPVNWAKYQEPFFIPLYKAALAILPLSEEASHLDAGCGSGLFLSMAVPSGARLHGVDAAPGMLTITRKRVPGASLLVEDLEDLPFLDGTFDSVTGFNSFQYAGSAQKAFAEASRVVKPMGNVAFGLWGREEDCEAAALFNAIAGLLPPSGSAARSPFALSDDSKVEAVCREAGLKIVRRQTVFCPWHFNCNEDLLAALLCTGPSMMAVQVAGADAVKDAVLESAQPFSVAEEVYYMRNRFTLYITEKTYGFKTWGFNQESI